MIPEKWNRKRIKVSIPDMNIKSCSVIRFLYVHCLEVITFCKAIVNNWYLCLQMLYMFIFAASNNPFIYLYYHRLIGIINIIDIFKIIRMIKIDVSYNHIIRIIIKKMSFIFASFKCKILTVNILHLK